MKNWRDLVKTDPTTLTRGEDNVVSAITAWFIVNEIGVYRGRIYLTQNEFDFSGVAEKLGKIGGKLIITSLTFDLRRPKIQGNINDALYEFDDGLIEIRANFFENQQVAIFVIGTSHFLSNILSKASGLFYKGDGPSSRPLIEILSSSQYDGLERSPFEAPFRPFRPDNYESNIVDTFYKMIKNIESKSPNGRLDILSGPPGTGKTSFVLGLIEACNQQDTSFLLLPVNMLAEITGPSLINLLKKNKKRTVMIIEDADHALVPREADNISEISTLLNLTDGIVGQAMDLYFIVTTNAKSVEVDDALKRPGRLHQLVQFDKLHPDVVNNIRQELSKPPFSDKKARYLSEAYNLP